MASVVAAGAGEGTSGGGGGGGGGGGEAAAVGIDWRQRGMAPSTGLGTHSRLVAVLTGNTPLAEQAFSPSSTDRNGYRMAKRGRKNGFE